MRLNCFTEYHREGATDRKRQRIQYDHKHKDILLQQMQNNFIILSSDSKTLEFPSLKRQECRVF